MASYFIDFWVVLDSDHMTLRWPSQRFVNSEPSYRKNQTPTAAQPKGIVLNKTCNLQLGKHSLSALSGRL